MGSTESHSFSLAKSMLALGYQVVLSDPSCSWCDELEELKRAGAPFVREFTDAISDVDSIIILTAWRQYRELDVVLSGLGKQDVVIIDPWRIVHPGEALTNLVL